MPGGRLEEKETGELLVCLAFTSDERKWKLGLAAVLRGAASVRAALRLWVAWVAAIITLLMRSHFFLHLGFSTTGLP